MYGVQRIGNEIYVIRDSTPYIEVYDRLTVLPKRNITISGMRGPYDMVKIEQYPASSLLIADWFSNTLIGVQIPQETVTVWSSVAENSAMTALGLAGPNRYTEGRAIVTSSSATGKLKKFGGPGNLVEEISIRDIPSPRQTIQVDSDRYAVCHGYGRPPEQHRVCLVDGDGRIDKCRGRTRGSGSDRFDVPARLEPFGSRCMLVADTGNRRVVLLGNDLDYLGTLISSGLNGPYRLHFDAEYKRLYVADNKVAANGIAGSGRVRIYLFK